MYKNDQMKAQCYFALHHFRKFFSFFDWESTLAKMKSVLVQFTYSTSIFGQ